MPAVILEALADTSMYQGLALGGGVVMRQSVLYTVLAETPAEARKISDILVAQRQKRIVLFDKNAVADAGAWPVGEDGMPVSGVYPDLVRPHEEGGFGWRQLRCQEFAASPTHFEPGSPVHAVSVRGVYEVDVP
jgi:hypothetical protein